MSGKFVLRIPFSMHERLVEIAKDEGMSMNSFVSTTLAAAIGRVDAKKETDELLARGFLPILIAPRDRKIWCYTAAAHGLQSFESECEWHPDSGFCTDELRNATHWKELPNV